MKRKASSAAAPPGIGTSEQRDRVRRVSQLLLAVIAAGMTLASCSSPLSGPPGPLGTVTGTLRAAGGSSGASPRPLSGQVTLHFSKGKIGIAVGNDGRFSVPVTVGTYTVTATSPQYKGGTVDCQAPGSLTVTKGVTSDVEITCPES
jgi:hypothetical protein